eukprot:11514413-Heterocapsa_arctica.AAC.1
MAMPCQSVNPGSSSNVKHYRYAIKNIKTVLPKPVVRNPDDVNIVDVVSYAVAGYRAIELANGEGLVNDTSDTELWRGVQDIDPNECRRLP